MVLTVSTFRLSASVREGERLKGQIEERDRENSILMRRLDVRSPFFVIQKVKSHHLATLLH